MSFIDYVEIKAKAGDGGDGSVSFRREKFVAAGGPDGGDGGKGGNVVFVVDRHLTTLIEFRFKKRYFADDGDKGSKRRSSGKSGEDLVIKVPMGTIIREAKSRKIMADLSDDEPVIVARGGNGGWGNSHFATPTRQVPDFAKPGLPGEEIALILELKLLADVGLVGFPNVGKSTLISVVSSAKPKIANYHFTTLEPNLGVVRIDETSSFVMADIPGLVEEASAGKGLGHDFLKHVERCRMILHIVDISGSEGRVPEEDFDKICLELARFNPEMAKLPQIVVGNKTDVATDEQIEKFRLFIEEKGLQFAPISAVTKNGTKELMFEVYKMLETLPPIAIFEREYVEEAQKGEKASFQVIKHDEYFEVVAPWLKRMLDESDTDDYESLQYFQLNLIKTGIIDELKNLGVVDGDTVRIYDFEFEYLS